MANVWSSTKLLEFDFAGIEAVIQGWCMRAPTFMRISRLGMHANVASHILGRPADLSWSDSDLAAYFKTIKDADDLTTSLAYNGAKRTVHAVGYGQTAMGTYLSNPHLFPTLKHAEKVREVYFSVAPEVPDFQRAVQRTAYEQGYLGGAATYQYDKDRQKVTGHPYQYQLQLNSVITYQRLSISQKLWREKRSMPVELINGIWYGIQHGEDAKRACAYYGQSIARGVLTEAAFPLFDPEEPLADRCYVGDFYYGETPLRAPIHDSLLFECPTRKVDRLIERVSYAMQRPIDALPLPPEWGMGEYLTIGVDAKIGDDWGAMQKLKLPKWEEFDVAADLEPMPDFGRVDDGDPEDDAQEEWAVPLVRATA